MGFLCAAFFISFFFSYGKCETVRCYCNLEVCKSQDYSCSFDNGGCFSDFLDYRDITQAKYGCLQLLDRNRQEQCTSVPEFSERSKSLLLCCQSDMCNHMLNPVSLVTHSVKGSLLNGTEGRNASGRMYDHRYAGGASYNTNEVWFKAATIAVPICGAMILLMLVALAFKILRTDQVNVSKYWGDSNSNANFPNSHIFSFKSNDLNPKDFSKKVPLLYEARHSEVHNCEDFRNFTATRIHYGQNVNRLRDKEESNPAKTEKNVENAKMNSERPRPEPQVEDGDEANNNSQAKPTRTTDVSVNVEDSRSVPTLSLNLEKNESLNSCNLYYSPRTIGEQSIDLSAMDKLYEKHLL